MPTKPSSYTADRLYKANTSIVRLRNVRFALLFIPLLFPCIWPLGLSFFVSRQHWGVPETQADTFASLHVLLLVLALLLLIGIFAYTTTRIVSLEKERDKLEGKKK
jgi:Na+/phosphate symporter